MSKQSEWLANNSFGKSLKLSIENGWLTDGKRLEGVFALLKKVDHAVLNSLPPVIILTPPITIVGKVMSYEQAGTLVVYLAPMLEFESQARVDFAVAHEFAHIALGHRPNTLRSTSFSSATKHEETPVEKATDELAESWGYKKPRGASQFSKFCAEFRDRRARAKLQRR